MTDQDKATAAAKAVLRELKDRKGFDWWWADIDADTRKEIRDAIAECIQDAYR